VLYILFWIFLVAMLGSWTGDEAGWVLSILFHRPIHVDWFLGFILNCFSGGFAIPFDVIVTIIRSVVGGQ